MRPPKERETAITQSSEDHSRWEVWTDDPYWQRRLDRIAIGRPYGSGKAYTLPRFYCARAGGSYQPPNGNVEPGT